MIFAGVQSGSRETRPSGTGSKRRDEMGVSRAIQRKVVEGRKKKELKELLERSRDFSSLQVWGVRDLRYRDRGGRETSRDRACARACLSDPTLTPTLTLKTSSSSSSR